MTRVNTLHNQRLSRAEKNKNDKQWYKDQADILDDRHNTNYAGYGGVSEYKRKKVNYDLFNNILNLEDFSYVCQPFGAEAGELPAKMVNRDIISGKVKALLGMEMKRAFPYSIIATNSEATTRKEDEEFHRIRQYVVNSILEPIKQNIELKYEEELRGGQLNPDEKQKLQQQIAQELETQTPEEVRKYMKREHQDPAEVLGQQLLNYLVKEQDVKRKFNKGFKHGLISGEEVYYVGEMNNHPYMKEMNPIRFEYDKSPDSEFIEDGEWAVAEYRLTPSTVIGFFGDELTPKDIDDIYEDYSYYTDQSIYDDMFSFREYQDETANTVRVTHHVWKSLRKVKFLSYLDEIGDIQEMIVDESYRLNREQGDISITEEWIPESYETWKIGTDKYVRMQPIPGQFKDLDNLYKCKLPYYGAAYDNLNSEVTSLVDRMKVYQYYYNIVMYRIELLMASDKGKKVLMNINAIPDSAGIDIEKWQYFFESTPFMWFNPNEEGTDYSDVNTIAKQIDLSLISDISKYIDLATYLKAECGKSVGITEQVEGQIGPNEAVTNTRQNITQSSHILEPYFDLHNHIKRNVLQALLEQAKVTYSRTKPKRLSFVLDDLSKEIINVDLGLLDNSTLGLFMADSSKADEIKNTIQQLSHAALQTQKVEFSDVIAILKTESIPEAEETLKLAEETRRNFEQSQTDKTLKANAEQAEKSREFTREQHEMEMEKIVTKEEERRKTEVIKAATMAASFNPDQDKDSDGINDFLEIAAKNTDLKVKIDKQNLDREKFEHTKVKDQKELDIKEKQLKMKAKDKK